MSNGRELRRPRIVHFPHRGHGRQIINRVFDNGTPKESASAMKHAFSSFDADLPRPAAIAVDARWRNYRTAEAWGRLCRMSGMPVRKIASC